MDKFIYTNFAFKMPFLAALILYFVIACTYLCFSFTINGPLCTQGVKYIFFLGIQDIKVEVILRNVPSNIIYNKNTMK